MRKPAILLALVAAASAQWIENVIALPESSVLRSVCFSRPTGKLYCATVGDSTLTIIDTANDSIIGSLRFDCGVSYLCALPDTPKLYCSNGYRLFAVDARADTITAEFDFEAWGYAFNPVTRKLYCSDDEGLNVLDTRADTLVTTIALDGSACELVCNPATNRLYTVHIWTHQVGCIDGAADTVRRYIPTGWHPNDLTLDTVLNRLYVTCQYPDAESSLHCINCSTEQVIRTLWPPCGPVTVCCNDRDHLVYAGTSPATTLPIVNGRTSQIVGTNWTGWVIQEVFYNSVSNKVYALHTRDDRLSVYHGTNFGMLARFDIPGGPWAFDWDPARNRVFIPCVASDSVWILGDDPAEVEEPPSRVPPGQGSLPTISRGVLDLGRELSAVGCQPALLDASGRRILDLHPGPNDIRHLSPGVYFVGEEGSRAQGAEGSSVRKVLILR